MVAALCDFNAVCVDGYVRSYVLCDREILLGVCVWFADPDPCGPMGFERTIFSWLGAWGTKEVVETRKSSWWGCCLPVGYSVVYKPQYKRLHFLLAQQRQPGSLTGWMPDFRVMLAGWQHLILHHFFGMTAQPASCHWVWLWQMELFMPIIEDIGHHLDKSSCWPVHYLTFTKALGWKVKTESTFGEMQPDITCHAAATNHYRQLFSSIAVQAIYINF